MKLVVVTLSLLFLSSCLWSKKEETVAPPEPSPAVEQAAPADVPPPSEPSQEPAPAE